MKIQSIETFIISNNFYIWTPAIVGFCTPALYLIADNYLKFPKVGENFVQSKVADLIYKYEKYISRKDFEIRTIRVNRKKINFFNDLQTEISKLNQQAIGYQKTVQVNKEAIVDGKDAVTREIVYKTIENIPEEFLSTIAWMKEKYHNAAD